ncbi:MAG: rhodanese-related sulfurtransferase [Pseudomonadales bacterium]
MLTVATFYQFVTLQALPELREQLLRLGRRGELRGTILLAPEGINATICGQHEPVLDFLEQLRGDTRFDRLAVKFSQTGSDEPVFLRYKVKIKSEIVTMGIPGIDVATHTAEHVDAQRFNALLGDPEVAVIDVRNQYETEIGTFVGAEDPGTESFRQFPEYVSERFGACKDQPIAMFCTGGIRCEKASAYLVEQGFTSVYQLDGGILKYLQTAPEDANLWHGECFVFDQRVTVDEALHPGDYVQCFACRRPVAPEQLNSPDYVEGVSCPACIGRKSVAGFAERQRQMQLASSRGTAHLGPAAAPPLPDETQKTQR